jgi:hypothetical protein
MKPKKISIGGSESNEARTETIEAKALETSDA